MVATTRLLDGLYDLPQGGYVATRPRSALQPRASLRPNPPSANNPALGGLRLARYP